MGNFLPWIADHQSLLLNIAGTILVLEQWLGATKKVDANSTSQLVSSLLVKVFKTLKILYQIGAGKALVILQDSSVLGKLKDPPKVEDKEKKP